MKRPGLVLLLLFPMFGAPFVAGTQSVAKVYRIGWLANDRYAPGDEAFQPGLRDLGRVKG
jgi:hypothetical protein